MANETDTLRLAAQLVDQFSGPLREMTKSVHNFQDMLRGGTKQTIKDNKEHAKLQKDLNEQFVNTGRTISGIVTPAMGALGLSVGGAGASIAALIANLKNAGGEFYKIQGAMKRTGLSSSELDAQSRAISKITGQSIEASRAQLAGLGDIKAQLGRNFAPTIAGLRSQFNDLDELVETLSHDSADKAYTDVEAYIASHPAAPDQQRKLLAFLGLDPNLADATSAERRKTLEDMRKFVGINPGSTQEQRAAWKAAFDDLDEAADGFGRHMQAAFGNDTVKLVERLAGVINRFTGGMSDYLDLMRGKAKPDNQYLKELQSPSEPSSPPGPKKPPFSDQKFQTFPNRLYHPSAFIEGGGSASDAENLLSRGVKSGTLAAFREWSASVEVGNSGVMNANYTTGGGGGGNPMLGGGIPKFGSKDFPDLSGRNGADVPSGSGPKPSGVTGNKREVAKIISDEWSRAGMSKEGIAGLMANVQDESQFNPNLRHPDQPKFGGEAHFAHGLYQEGGTEWNHYAAWLQKNYSGSDWRDPRLQSRFAAENLKKNYAGTWRKMNEGSRFQAGAAYVNEYLKPAAQYRYGRMNKYMHGGVAPLESYTGPPEGRDLISNANKAGMAGGQQKIEGGADLRVAFENAPSGMKAHLKNWGIFGDGGKVDWGHPMSPSDPGGR
jgi:hypothetical protein